MPIKQTVESHPMKKTTRLASALLTLAAFATSPLVFAADLKDVIKDAKKDTKEAAKEGKDAVKDTAKDAKKDGSKDSKK